MPNVDEKHIQHLQILVYSWLSLLDYRIDSADREKIVKETVDFAVKQYNDLFQEPVSEIESVPYPGKYRPTDLRFNTLRDANKERLPAFTNSKGEMAHSMVDGSDWNPAQWLQAVIGELGEYANFRKKFERGDIDYDTYSAHAKKELADAMVYLDILAQRALDIVDKGRVVVAHPEGVDLSLAVVAKWNEVSERVKCPIKINSDGFGYYYDNEKGM